MGPLARSAACHRGGTAAAGCWQCTSRSVRLRRVTEVPIGDTPDRSATSSGSNRRFYVDRVRSDPDALRGSLGFYRAFDTTLAQNDKRASEKLPMPVLAVGGAASYGDHVAHALEAVASDVKGVIVLGAGHWVAEQAPDELLNAVAELLAPYRNNWSDQTALAGQAVR